MKKNGIVVGGILLIGFALIGVGYVLAPDMLASICAPLFLALILLWIVFRTPQGKAILTHIRGLYYGIRLHGKPCKMRVDEKCQFLHPEKIRVGQNCTIRQNALFSPLGEFYGKKYPSEIIIGNRVYVGAFDRIASMNRVEIEDDVMIAAFVHITDHSHEYRNVGPTVSGQGVYSKGPVHIKRGAWLAFGCHILSGVTIGECAVVAANAVVTKDVPPYSVVAGNPARVVSQYNFETKAWESVKQKPTSKEETK